MNAQTLATEARKSISTFCMSECNAYCCRKGYLVLSKEELVLLTGNKQAELEQKEFIKPQEDGSFSFNLGNHLGSCPRLDGSICTIHQDQKRPKTCESFPIFINEEKKRVRFSPRCLAVKENRFLAYEHAFRNIGYEIGIIK